MTTGCSGGGSSSGGSASTAAATNSSTPGATTSGTTAPAAPAPSPIATQPVAGTWYKGDLHSHSATHSDDARRQLGDDIATTVRVAEKTGLDFLAGTDHRTNALLTDTNFSSQTMVLLPGMEWGGSMHAGAIGFTSPIPVSSTSSGAALAPEIDAIVSTVQSQGGIFVLNHPCEDGKLWVADIQNFDAIEVWNGPYSMRDWTPLTQQDLDDKAAGLGLTAAGVAPNPHMVAAITEQRGGPQLQALAFYESYLNSGRRVAAVGGGDRHMLLPQGSPTTRVYAATRDRKGILDGIRQGRTYISRKPSGPLVDFRADKDGDGAFESMIGDEVTAGTPAEFRIVIEGAPGGRVDVIKNSVVIRSEPIVGNNFVLTFSDVPATGDWYRLDVFELIDPRVQQSTGLILRAAQASGKDWAVLLALFTTIRRSALDFTYGTLLPTLLLPEEVDKVTNASLKDPGYCRGAITSPIYTSR
ncbi:MAG: CehA/McbA family metallohydrolase [Planctomycetes bacterium]|nr:CehA/McbA family metallohydrolase [Planctomycetota bacterium]